MFQRKLERLLKNTKKSLLILGPRQTGKSTLARLCQPEVTINLARESEFLEFTSKPTELEDRLSLSKPKTVFIDEIQRLPSLLNTIQAIIDEKKSYQKFYLTGSSARKLKRGHANLLPGRIHIYHLGPLFWEEFTDDHASINELLSTGTLPGILNEESVNERQKILSDYAGTYLKEEVQAEALAKDIEGFSRFLKIVGSWVGDFMDISKMASEAQIKRLTAMRYFDILQDTLIVERIQPFAKSDRKRLIQHPKYYFFDVGVWNGLLGNFSVSSDRIGKLFEHFMYNQISSAAKAYDEKIQISTYRTEHGAEIDFIIETKKKVYALELKASKNVDKNDLRGFESFKKYYGKKFTPIVAYLGTTSKQINNIPVLNWRSALNQIIE